MSNIQKFDDGSAAQVLEPLSHEQEAAQALRKAMEVLTLAKAVVIKTEEDYSAADAAVASIKNAQKAAEAKRTGLVKPLNDTVKKINAEFKPVDAAFEEALACYRRPMSAYQAELDRQRREAEAAARKERERLEAEARAKAEAEVAAARKAQEEADAARAAVAEDDPFAAILAEDEAAEAERRADEASEAAKQALREVHAVNVPVVVAPKVTGSASKTFTVWEFEIEDPALVPLAYRPIDTAAIARDVKAGKGECKIPGVRVFSRIEVK